MADVTNGIFSDYCYNQMWNLFKNHDNEVGKYFKGDKAGRSLTDCIIYVSNVLIYGHEKIGRSDRNDEIRRLGLKLEDGSKLANYLVRTVGWNAHYWNPDVREPRDRQSEHPASYKDVLKEKVYLPNSSNLPVSGLIVDYNKTTKKSSSETIWMPMNVPNPVLPIIIPFPSSVTVSNENTAILEKVSKVKFAFGLTRGATHTFLFSYGEVFEVHWANEGATLYGKVAFKDYEWLSGALIVPPDSDFSSDEIKAR